MGTPPLFRPSFDCVMGRRLLVAAFATTVLAALVAGQSVEVSVYFPLNPPFVMLDVDPESDGSGLGFGGLYGYDIELWSFVEAELANSLPRFRFVRRIATWEEMLNRTASSELAIGMSGVTITGPRAFSRDFSHPYFSSGLEFLIPQKDDVANLELVFSPFTPALWLSVWAIITISGIIVWCFEHTYQPREFPLNFIRGINEGIWFCWSIVSETKVNDVIGFPTRMYAIGFTWFAVALVAAYTAQLTAVLAVEQLDSDISKPTDLFGRNIATVRSTTAEDFLRELFRNSVMLAFSNVETALQAVVDGNADALLYDAAILEYLLRTDRRLGNYRLLGQLVTTERFGIVLSKALDSDVQQAVNTAVLKALDSGLVLDLNVKWFGKKIIERPLLNEITVEPLDFFSLAGSYVILALSLVIAILSYCCLRILRFCCP